MKLTKAMIDAMCAPMKLSVRENRAGAERFMEQCKADPEIQRLYRAIEEDVLRRLPCSEVKH